MRPHRLHWSTLTEVTPPEISSGPARISADAVEMVDHWLHLQLVMAVTAAHSTHTHPRTLKTTGDHCVKFLLAVCLTHQISQV